MRVPGQHQERGYWPNFYKCPKVVLGGCWLILKVGQISCEVWANRGGGGISTNFDHSLVIEKVWSTRGIYLSEVFIICYLSSSVDVVWPYLDLQVSRGMFDQKL